jgi:hypothetical protein
MFCVKPAGVRLCLLLGLLAFFPVSGSPGRENKAEGDNERREKTDVRVSSSPLFTPSKFRSIAIFVQDERGQAFASDARAQHSLLSKTPNTFTSYKFFAIRTIEDEFMIALINKGYEIAARTDIPTMLKELGLQNSGITDKDVSQIGKFVNVAAILLVTVGSSYNSLSARLLSVETSELLWLGSTATGPRWDQKAQDVAAVFPALVDTNAVKSVEKRYAQSEHFSEDSVSKVALLLIENELLPAQPIEDALFGSLMNKGYGLPARQNMQAVLKEQQFQNTGLTGGESAAFGKLLNVQAVLVFGLNYMTEDLPSLGANGVGNSYRAFSFGARLIGVQSGRVLWVGCTEANVAINRAEADRIERNSLLLSSKQKVLLTSDDFINLAISLGNQIPAKGAHK